MSDAPVTFFGDPVDVWLDGDLDEPLLCLDLSEVVDGEVGELLINFDVVEGAKLAARILQCLAARNVDLHIAS